MFTTRNRVAHHLSGTETQWALRHRCLSVIIIMMSLDVIDARVERRVVVSPILALQSNASYLADVDVHGRLGRESPSILLAELDDVDLFVFFAQWGDLSTLQDSFDYFWRIWDTFLGVE